jgi:uncharacterized protein (TIGR02466 family)
MYDKAQRDQTADAIAAPLSKVEVKLLFPTPVVFAELDDAAEINRVLRELVMARAVTASVVKSNSGGWQSEEDFPDWGGDVGRRVLRSASDLAHAVTVVNQDNELRREPFTWNIAAWANINRAGDSNVHHAHPGSFWSGTYYVEDGKAAADEETGGIFEMLDPRGIAPQMYAPNLCCGVSGCATAGRAEQFQPRAGQLALFPSWLIHSVTPYRGTRARISIAFNLSL